MSENMSGLHKSPKKSLKEYPIISSILITILIGLFLQMTYIIRLKDRLEQLTSSNLAIHFLDFSFRFILGAILIVIIIPILFKYLRKDGYSKEYVTYIRLTSGYSINRTIFIGILSIIGYLLIVFIIAEGYGIFNPNPKVLATDNWWFILILALVPGIWEELGFRGVILRNLEQRFSTNTAVILSGVLFGIFHFSNLLKDPLDTVIFLAIMATLLGIAWGYMAVKSNSVLPAIASHYLIDVVLASPWFVDLDLATSDQTTTFFLGITIIYPILAILIVKRLFHTKNTR